MENKHKYIYLALGGSILLIYFILVAFIIVNKPNSSSTQTINLSPTPTTLPLNQTEPEVTYDTEATRKLQKLFNERDLLSASDQDARKKLLQSIGSKTVTFSQTTTYTLRYILPLDIFQAQINTVDIASAKEDVADYFTSKGISKKGICHLPLTFYLSKATSQQLKGRGLSFSPIPEGC